jgi:hypothetical protein
MDKRRRAALALTALVLLILAALLGLQVHGLPGSIETSKGEATIHFAVDRSWRLLADSCFTVNWQVEQINAVYINGDSETGLGEAIFCGTSQANLTVDFRDGSSETYRLPTTPFFATPLGWLLLISITILVYGILYLLDAMLSPAAFLWAMRQSLRETSQEMQSFFSRKNLSHLLLLGAVLILGTALRLVYLDGPMRYDESASLSDYVLVDNIFDSLSRYERPNNHLLNTLLMYLSMKSFGSMDEWVLRLPHLIAGSLTIVLSYIAARQQFNKEVALLAAGMVATSSAMIVYSAMARGYMLQIAFFLGLVILTQRLVKAPNPTVWFAFVVCTALGFYSVLTMLYGFAGLALYLLIHMLRQDKSRTAEWLIGLGWASWFTLLLYIPLLSRFGLNAIVANGYTKALAWEAFFQQLPRTIEAIAEFWLGGIPLIVWPILLAGFLLGLLYPFFEGAKTKNYKGSIQERSNLLPVLPMVLLATVLIIIIQHPALYAALHIFLFLLPLIAIHTAAGFVYVFSKIKFGELFLLVTIALLALGILISRSAYLTYEGGAYHDAEAVAAYLAQAENPNFRLALSPNYDEPLNYYFRRYGIPLERMSREYRTVDSIYFIVRDSLDPSVQGVMQELIGGRTAAEFSEPQLAASFEFSDLYRIDRP